MKKFDCIIAGAGLSGFAAAVGASAAGAKVLLLDSMPCVGGTAVYTITPVLSGWRKAEWCTGVGQILSDKLRKNNAYFWSNTCRILAHEDKLQRAMLEVLQDHGVEMLFNAPLCGVKRSQDRIESVTVTTSGGLLELGANTFVDATGSAALSVLAGAETVVPDDEVSMTKTLMFKVRNVKGFDRDEVRSLFKEHVSEFPVKIQNSFMGLPLPETGEVLLNLTAVTGNAADPDVFSAMYGELFAQIDTIMEFMRRNIPCFSEAVVTKVAPVVGVRYTRSVRGLCRIEMDDLFNQKMTSEPVAFCSDYIGGHYVKKYESPWGAKVIGDPAVPYGAIRARGVSNLLTAGRIIDIDPRAVTAIRLAAQCIGTGQAAGIAAALGVPDYQTLYAELDRQNCMQWLKDVKNKTI